MSYILDALRKSEADRLAGGVPGLTTPQAALPPAQPRPGRWIVAAALLVTINAGALGWWLTRSTAPAPQAPTPSEPPRLVLPPAYPAVPPPTAPEAPIPAPAPPDSRENVAGPVPRVEKPSPAVAVLKAPPARPAVPPEEAPVPPPRSGVIPYADLPPAIKKALPPLQIGGYADAGGGEIMLLVDDRLVKEGDDISGVKVVKIAPEGTVFSYRNYRFRR